MDASTKRRQAIAAKSLITRYKAKLELVSSTLNQSEQRSLFLSLSFEHEKTLHNQGKKSA